MTDDKRYTVEEARKLFLDAAAAAEAKLPASVASKLTGHLREVAGFDLGSNILAFAASAWIQCAEDLIAMPGGSGVSV